MCYNLALNVTPDVIVWGAIHHHNGASSVAEWPVVGHEWAVSLLGRAIQTGHISHAYLFTGPLHVGKMTLARAFAQALCCQSATGAPCGECSACQRIAQGRYPDVQFIAAEKATIQIDQVRALQADAALTPLEGHYKVFAIREIERASPPAANALLKILEEPPPRVILLLTSARRDQVLPTVFSRCQPMPLRPLPTSQVQAALEQRWGVAEEQAALLARLSSGALGWAVRAHADSELWQMRSRVLDELQALPAEGVLGRLAYAEALARQKESLETVLGMWAVWWRDVLLIQRGLPDAIVNLDRRTQLTQQAALHSPQTVERVLQDVMLTVHRLKANVNVRLALDVLTLRLPAPAA
jgi:DNA polymerase-3 subunit delta'